MKLFALPSLIAFLIAFFLGTFVYAKNPRQRLSRLFFCLCLLESYYAFTSFELSNAENYEIALFWWRAGAFWYFLTPLLLHFILVFTGGFKKKSLRTFYVFMYAPALIFSAFNLSGHYFYEGPIKGPWGWTYRPVEDSLAVNLAAIWIIIQLIMIIGLCIRHFSLVSSLREKKQVKFLLIGISITIIMGFLQFSLPSLGLQIPDYFSIAFIVGSCFWAYAIRRYKLFVLSPETAAKEIIHTMSDVLFLIDLEGKIKVVNQSALIQLGFKKDELIDKSIKILLEEDDYNKVFKGPVHDELMNAGFFSDIEVSLKSKDKGKTSISLAGSLILDDRNQLQGMAFIGRDITRRKIEERELRRHKEHLEELVDERTAELKKTYAQIQRGQRMELMGTLAGTVAHDLNNILSGLIAYPELLLLDIPKDSPFRNPVEAIKKSGEKAAVIVQDMLTLARRNVDVKEVVNLNSIIQEFLESPEYKKINSYHPEVEVVTHLDPDLPNLIGSPVHLSKVIMNLVGNAAEAMPTGGKVSISTHNCRLESVKKGYEDIDIGDYVTVSIADLGIGIPPEEIERIFEPFYTKKVMGRSGSGLGMAVVWGTVKDHQGYIDVESEQGVGTTFTLYFPASESTLDKDEHIIPMQSYKGKGETVLVVDDSDEQREIACMILRKLGYRVEAVSSGERAVDYLRHKRVDILILDMIMEPGIDGLETYKRILAMYPDQRAIIASGYSETERLKEAQRLGAESHIKKPYTIETIGVAVKSELEKQT